MYLCDSEGLTQEVAGARREISRDTVQRLLNAAGRKVVDALMKGIAVSIKTGVASRDWFHPKHEAFPIPSGR